ncbi:MAG TPA: hypothetical protein VNO55_08500 [Polyangia bacterium]|nr:hypothetical protein [Polyangia bacterium]
MALGACSNNGGSGGAGTGGTGTGTGSGGAGSGGAGTGGAGSGGAGSGGAATGGSGSGGAGTGGAGSGGAGSGGAAVDATDTARDTVADVSTDTSRDSTMSGGNFTAAQVFAGLMAHESAATKVNTLPHINTQTRAMNVNVYQVATGVFAYSSGMAIDTDGADPDPDPDHQGTTTWQDSSGKALGAHHVPFYVMGDDCWDNEGGGKTVPCPHFFYAEHDIAGRQFALIFYKNKAIGAVFGDTQTANNQTTSDNDARELGEASVESAILLGIPSSGTTGGVDSGVTVVIFSGPSWVVQGTNAGTGPVGSATGSLNANAQALVQKALNQLGTSFGL